MLRMLGRFAVATVMLVGLACPTSARADSGWSDEQAARNALVWADQYRTNPNHLDDQPIQEVLGWVALGDTAQAEKVYDDALKGQDVSVLIGGGGEPGSLDDTLIAQLMMATEALGKDVHQVNGFDLAAALRKTMVTTGEAKGRYISQYPGLDLALSGTPKSQAQDIMALAAIGDVSPDAVNQLVRFQCKSGGFPQTFSVDNETISADCESMKDYQDNDVVGLSVEDTAWALMGMKSARSVGISGLDDPIARAEAWLRQRQASNGSWSDTYGENQQGAVTVSLSDDSSLQTIVALSALSPGCANDDALIRGRAFLRKQQINNVDDAGSDLEKESGVLPPTAADRVIAREGGMEGNNDLHWVRPTVISPLGFLAVPVWNVLVHDDGRMLKPSGCATATSTPASTEPSSSSSASTGTKTDQQPPSGVDSTKPATDGSSRPVPPRAGTSGGTGRNEAGVVAGASAPRPAGASIVPLPGARPPVSGTSAQGAGAPVLVQSEAAESTATDGGESTRSNGPDPQGRGTGTTSPQATPTASAPNAAEGAAPGDQLMPRADATATGNESTPWWRQGWVIALGMVAAVGVGIGTPGLVAMIKDRRDVR